jgi:CRISPR-associated protein Csx14
MVASIGITPQIVTEVLYYYYTRQNPRRFQRICLVTTAQGQQRLQATLLDGDRLADLERVIGLAPGAIPLKLEDVQVFRDARGAPLEDIRTTADSQAEMRQVLRLIHDLSRDPRSRLTVVIAGGRKSMSVGVALALQLFGREQDELVHVLVPHPYDNQPEWFFPTDPDDPRQRIEVTRIPFLRVGRYLTRVDWSNPLGMIELAQERLDELLPIDRVVVGYKQLVVDGHRLHLPPVQMALWRYFARLKTEACRRPERDHCGECRDCFVDNHHLMDALDREITEEYRLLRGEQSVYWRRHERERQRRLAANGTLDTWTERFKRLRQTRSKVNRTLRRQMGNYFILDQLLIQTAGKGAPGERRYGLKLDRHAIRLQK